uniref:Small ribosomal subunit protein uS3c n=1 Tax=Scherffelia dubia TaxID=3190 RepID=A0A142BY92_SCHDU|nr:ribosomal protein S3 [Scherffelia dubia]AMP43384.1 ribosomal protein S3 [Scherffelia dubia]
MGQKVHPVGFRLGITKKHQSQWFTSSKNYPILTEQDRFLRTTLFEKYREAGISSIQIERKMHQIWITLLTSNPRILIGKGENNLDIIRTDLQGKLEKYTLNSILTQPRFHFFQKDYLERPSEIALFVKKLRNPDADVTVIAQFLVDQLEQRTPFRRAIRQAIQKAKRQKVQGIKIQISGRLNGAEIARTEWVREGRVPLQTLRANIDYCYTTAKTIYGLLGIKIWIFQGDEKSALRG